MRGMEREPPPPPAIGRAAITVLFGPGFAPGNRDQRLCGEWSANRIRLRRSAGPLLVFFSARGSRPETEVKGFAGNGARTAFASGGRPGRYYRFFRPGVRARKPRLKALRGMKREPPPPPAADRAAITVFQPYKNLHAGGNLGLPTACRFSVFTFLTAVPWKSPARSR